MTELAVKQSSVLDMDLDGESNRFFPKSFLQWSELHTLMKTLQSRDIHLYLYGIPGTGKSHFAGMVANYWGVGIQRLHGTEDTFDAEMAGHYAPVDSNGGYQKFEWINRPGLRAWIEGCIFVIEDIHKLTGSARDVLLGLADDRQEASWTLPDGSKITPHDDFQIIATSNGTPDDLDDALRDRLFPIHIQYPHPGALMVLRALDESLATFVYNSYVAGSNQMTFREAVRIARLAKDLNRSDVIKLAYPNRASDLINGLEALESARDDNGEEDVEDEEDDKTDNNPNGLSVGDFCPDCEHYIDDNGYCRCDS